MAQAYLDELNKLVNQTNTSTAHRERVFIEQRLRSAQQDLERAQIEMSEFSSKNSTIDLKEQTRAMVDAAARVQAELTVEQSGFSRCASSTAIRMSACARPKRASHRSSAN